MRPLRARSDRRAAVTDARRGRTGGAGAGRGPPVAVHAGERRRAHPRHTRCRGRLPGGSRRTAHTRPAAGGHRRPGQAAVPDTPVLRGAPPAQPAGGLRRHHRRLPDPGDARPPESELQERAAHRPARRRTPGGSARGGQGLGPVHPLPRRPDPDDLSAHRPQRPAHPLLRPRGQRTGRGDPHRGRSHRPADHLRPGGRLPAGTHPWRQRARCGHRPRAHARGVPVLRLRVPVGRRLAVRRRIPALPRFLGRAQVVDHPADDQGVQGRDGRAPARHVRADLPPPHRRDHRGAGGHQPLPGRLQRRPAGDALRGSVPSLS